jgi:hypothetical protein
MIMVLTTIGSRRSDNIAPLDSMLSFHSDDQIHIVQYSTVWLPR